MPHSDVIEAIDQFLNELPEQQRSHIEKLAEARRWRNIVWTDNTGHHHFDKEPSGHNHYDTKVDLITIAVRRGIDYILAHDKADDIIHDDKYY
ncbi:hypothetical protein [Paenibacillus sp. P32E]|uniref:hypothetical protein n=1 Tax=Paenibacillus sp. P32E TaxID=1349434 RepID=UPI00093B697B|nr:hypothetical protein [Paenibacillus sp. P32E]OKP91339.1 hypothetical protein A3848_09535 [Paenibacillus sp. P32E]